MYYSTRVAQHLLFSGLVLVSLASFLQGEERFLQGKERFLQRWNGNDDEASATCNVNDEITKLDQLITDIKVIKKDLQNCVFKCSQALVFSGNIKEYAKWVQPANGATGGTPDAMTACFWMKTKKTTQTPTVLSYAVPQRDNEFLIFLQSSNLVVFLKNGKGVAGATFYSAVAVSDGEWHHVCITWKSSDGRVDIYKNGVFEEKKTGLIIGKKIELSGTWIIGQDQDNVGGGFSEADAFDGSLTDVNVWNRILNANEISTLASISCGSGMQGNYKAYKDFVPQGGVQQIKTSCCR